MLCKNFLLNTLVRERQNRLEDEEEEISSYWMTRRKREEAGI
jgi:hypothetical protein